MSSNITTSVRPGCKDIWNAYMLNNATFSKHDIPRCPTTAHDIPNRLISYENAKRIHNLEMKMENDDYHIDAFVHFYIDDQKFDGKESSIWTFPEAAVNILRHFSGIIAPDFSTYLDFPDPLKRWNLYRMNSFGYWYGSLGHQVYCNARWGAKDTWEYCFDGIESNSAIAIGTVASGLKQLINRSLFEDGLFELVRQKNPSTILVYGSSKYDCFDELKKKGIVIIAYPSQISQVYARRSVNEQII